MPEGLSRIDGFDYRNPDYLAIFRARADRLKRIRAAQAKAVEDGVRTGQQPIALLKAYYRDHVAQFITDWGMTFDPRNPERGLPSAIPFLLFERQSQFVDWVIEHWKTQHAGLCDKSRELGVSWLTVAIGVAISVLYEGVSIGYGSRLQDYVDKIGEPKSLFWKARFFLAGLPVEFRAGHVAGRDDPHMRLIFPETGSSMGGEGGANIGRGDRRSVYFIDESAHVEHPEMVDAALSMTTNCRIDVSSANGRANPFAQKRFSYDPEHVFTMHWRAQPLDAKLLTPTGWRLMGDIKVGDSVIGSDGKSKKVIGVYPQGVKPVYKIGFNDGASTECCGDHLWSVIPYQNQRAERKHIRQVVPLSALVDDYVETDSRGYRKHNYQIPVLSAPVVFRPVQLPIDPYVMGCLLGDGSFPKRSEKHIVLSIGDTDKEIVSLVNERLPPGCSVKPMGGIQYRLSSDNRHCGGTLGPGWHNPINIAVRSLKLDGTQSHNKFIPDIYLRASPEDRLSLIQGLMDTDGCTLATNPGAGSFKTVSKALAEGIVFLAETLGGTTTTHIVAATDAVFPGGRTCKRRDAYQVLIRLPDGLIPFRLQRKRSAHKESARYKPRRSIVSIAPAGEKECRCIKVDSLDGLYLTDRCIVTHNSDPRKDDAWYRAKVEEINNPVIVAQELDIDYSASTEGVLIPSAWVQAAIDAHVKLGFPAHGARFGALDVADEGKDTCAYCGAHGSVIEHIEEWSGKGSDPFATAERAFGITHNLAYTEFRYDADGIGAYIRGDARVINERRQAAGQRPIKVTAYRASDGVVDPHREDIPGRKNEDYYKNFNAQSWWALRTRFMNTHRAVVDGVKPVPNPDKLISLDSKKIPARLLQKLCVELSQPTCGEDGVGRIIINKAPDGAPSPNLADAVKIRFAPMKSDWLANLTNEAVAKIGG